MGGRNTKRESIEKANPKNRGLVIGKGRFLGTNDQVGGSACEGLDTIRREG